MTRTEELEQAVERTRAHLAQTAEALKDKLSPRRISQDLVRSPAFQSAGAFTAAALPFALFAGVAAIVLRARKRRLARWY